ncbi:hypothetical protein CUMW_044540 [Citrus unshiu]|nr:hypothetical protein CUMW_044540 [Citrus unshiu]
MRQMVPQAKALNLKETLQTQQENAEEALHKLNGTVIGKQSFRADYGNQWSGAYYGGQVYDGYGYAIPPPNDPSMYAAAAAAYGAYPVYGSHQQQVS